ncbi:MAG: Ig-like domain-containing protein [Pseudomonadales bacterium]|nr:Ig-like domain-containing protein [Pseudomonadales bacterium]
MIRTKPLSLYVIFCGSTLVGSLAHANATESDSAANNTGNMQLTGDQNQVKFDYIGDQSRIGIGINDDFDLVAEIMHGFLDDGDSVWIGEGWFSRGAGGLKLNYHWLSETVNWDDPAQVPDGLKTYKVFAAVDQNREDDRKVTLGGGFENKDLFASLYISASFTGSRETGVNRSTLENILSGVDATGSFQQTEFTTTTTRVFEHAYDYGIGARIGTYFDQSLVRLRGGLDYEVGDYDSDQFTLSAAVEKFFENTRHSLALSAEHIEKSGDFEIDDRDTRVILMWRYSFGGDPYQPSKVLTQEQVEKINPAVAPVTEMKLMQDNVDLRVEALFGLDQSSLNETSLSAISKIVNQLNKGAIVGKISVVGFTCDLGSSAYNKALSERRALAVRRQLIALGVDPANILVEGRGEAQPKVPNTSEENRRLNRRVQIQFLQAVEREVVVQPGKEETREMIWTQRQVDNVPAWIKRSMYNPVQHKRTVDVYRYEKEETEVTLGEKTYLNAIPVAAADQITVRRNSGDTIIDALANDTDQDGEALSIVAVTQPANGVATNFGDVISYRPAAGFVGTDQIEYTIQDSQGETATAVIEITVTNTIPTASNDSISTSANTPVLIPVLDNDRDDDSDSLQITQVGNPANGSVSIEGDLIRYIPATGFVGTDSFTYTVTDGFETTVATVTVTVQPGAPTSGADSAETEFETPVTIDVLANDSAFNGGVLTIVGVSQPANGSVEIVNGVVVYTPNSGFSGTDSFTYTIREAGGEESTGTVSVVVAEDDSGNGGGNENNAPEAVNDVIFANLTDTITLDVLANDTDADGDALTVVSIDNLPRESQAIITLNEDGSITFVPQANWRGGVLEFTYRISDGKGGFDVARVKIKC